jgi:hypothetical protein
LLQFSPSAIRIPAARRSRHGDAARAHGGTGDPFNLGETSHSLFGSLSGMSARLCAGRERRKAELVAVFDALLQDPGHQPRLEHSLLEPLRSRLSRQRSDADRQQFDQGRVLHDGAGRMMPAMHELPLGLLDPVDDAQAVFRALRALSPGEPVVCPAPAQQITGLMPGTAACCSR